MNDRKEWLEWRRGGIGASDVAAIVGLSRFGSPMSVWADKTGLASGDDDNEYMEFGRRAEVMVGPWFTDRTGLLVAGEQTWCVHPGHNHHRATVDGLVVESLESVGISDALGVLEIKTSGEGEWQAVPDDYECQVQWQMHVTGLPHAWLAVLHGRKFRTYEVPRDDRAIGLLVEMVDSFWNAHVLGGVAPPADGSEATSRALRDAFPAAEPGLAVDISDISDAISEMAEAKAERKRAEERVRAAENAIKAALGEAEVGLVRGEPAVTWRTVEKAGYVVEPSSYRRLMPVKGYK